MSLCFGSAIRNETEETAPVRKQIKKIESAHDKECVFYFFCEKLKRNFFRTFVPVFRQRQGLALAHLRYLLEKALFVFCSFPINELLQYHKHSMNCEPCKL